MIELDEIHDLVIESSDAGGLYARCDWTFRGNIVRHNFFHDILSRPGLGSKVVYNDDCASSIGIVGNVLCRAPESAFVGGGHHNRLENNISIDCERPVQPDTPRLTWAHFQPDGPMVETLRPVPFDRPAWSIRYPALAPIIDERLQAPSGRRSSGTSRCARAGSRRTRSTSRPRTIT